MLKLICFVGKGGVGKTYLSVRAFKNEPNPNKVLLQIDQQYNAEMLCPMENVIRVPESTLLEEIISLTPYREFVGLIRDIAPDFKMILGLLSYLYDHRNEDLTVFADFPPNCQTLSLLTLPDITQTMIFKIIKTKEKIASFLKKEPTELIIKAEKLAEIVKNTIEILKTATFNVICVPDLLSFVEMQKIEDYLQRFSDGRAKIRRVLNKMPIFDSIDERCSKCLVEKEIINRLPFTKSDFDEVVYNE